VTIEQGAAEPIIRLAAKGDGVTPSGRHVPGAVPGDMVEAGGTIIPGAHHIDPACLHFGTCGGCQLQHADDSLLADFVRDRVVNAAKRQGLEVEELLPVHLSRRVHAAAPGCTRCAPPQVPCWACARADRTAWSISLNVQCSTPRSPR
jgi:hypothetical protein